MFKNELSGSDLKPSYTTLINQNTNVNRSQAAKKNTIVLKLAEGIGDLDEIMRQAKCETQFPCLQNRAFGFR